MQRSLSVDDVARRAHAYPAVPHAPDHQDDLAFFTSLWAILPIALGGWVLIVWGALQILG